MWTNWPSGVPAEDHHKPDPVLARHHRPAWAEGGRTVRPPKLLSRSFYRRPLVLLLITGAIYVAVAIPLGSRAGNWSEVIYFVTGAILVWYTVETHALRMEATRQAERAVRPAV